VLRDWVSEGGGDFYEGGFHDPIRVDCMEGQVWVCVWTFCTYKTLPEVSILQHLLIQ
jgi:hypothetical protein